jgi:hypothetical protein
VSNDTLFGYSVIYVDGQRVPDIVLQDLAYLSSDLNDPDWPHVYRRQCEEIERIVRNLLDGEVDE